MIIYYWDYYYYYWCQACQSTKSFYQEGKTIKIKYHVVDNKMTISFVNESKKYALNYIKPTNEINKIRKQTIQLEIL